MRKLGPFDFVCLCGCIELELAGETVLESLERGVAFVFVEGEGSCPLPEAFVVFRRFKLAGLPLCCRCCVGAGSSSGGIVEEESDLPCDPWSRGNVVSDIMHTAKYDAGISRAECGASKGAETMGESGWLNETPYAWFIGKD